MGLSLKYKFTLASLRKLGGQDTRSTLPSLQSPVQQADLIEAVVLKDPPQTGCIARTPIVVNDQVVLRMNTQARK